MYKITITFLAIIALYGCNSSKMTSTNSRPNTLTTKEVNDGWKLLFDGQSLNGWHTYGQASAGKAWKVEDGVLRLDAVNQKNYSKSDKGDLVTNNDYENFDLQLDWKISKNGNSGVMIYVKDDAAKYSAPYFTGPEMQVLDNDGHPDGKLIKHRAGDLYDLISSSKEMAKPVGEWNHAEIISHNGKLDFYLNGGHTINTNMWDDNWRKMIAGSKFKEWPDFGTFKKGKIDLQDHGNNVWFRNIKIRTL